MPEIYAFLLEKTAILLIMFVAVLVVVAWTTLAERRYAGFFQDRLGPNRAGPLGLLQPIADGVKFFMKEEFIPDKANKVLFVIAPTFSFMAPGFLMAVIPFGDRVELFGRIIPLQIADLNVGILYILAISSLGVYGVIMGGWSSNNKYSLMGGLRASSQMISYEIAMGLALVALILDHGTLSLNQIVWNQTGPIWHWSVFSHPIGFVIFLVAAFAESARVPFDLPEAENELVAGFHTEYSAMKYGLFMLGEYIHMTIASALMATLYFGGWSIRALAALQPVDDYAAAGAIVGQCAEAFGRVDIVVNCAGVLRERMIWNLGEDDWDTVIRVHLKGHYNLCHHAAKVMRGQRWGRLINFASDAWRGSVGQANYAAAKGGIVSLTRALARELGRYGVTANALCPIAATRMTMNQGVIDGMKRRLETGLITQERFDAIMAMPGPEYVAPMVAYLATDAAADVNGHIFHVEKGRVSIYCEPVEEKMLIKSQDDGLFTVEELIGAVPGSLLVGHPNPAPAEPQEG